MVAKQYNHVAVVIKRKKPFTAVTFEFFYYYGSCRRFPMEKYRKTTGFLKTCTGCFWLR